MHAVDRSHSSPDISSFYLEQQSKTYKKMIKCAQKAIGEDGLAESLKDVPLGITFKGFPMQIVVQASSLQGKRSHMEDSYFHFEEMGLFGVIDGHGDNGEIGPKVAKECQNRFFEELEKAGNVKQAFKNLFKSIHDGIDAEKLGAVLVVCYIDKSTGVLYTATLGDSRAMVCRKFNEKFYSIPTSLVKTWKSKTEYKRAKKFYKDTNPDTYKSIIGEYKNCKNHKHLRFPLKGGLNVSRAIGDKQYGDVISQVPIVTMTQLLPDDKLLVYTDGASDVLNPTELNNLVIPYWNDSKEDLATRIACHAIYQKGSKDNTTMLVVSLEQKSEKENPSSESDSDSCPSTEPYTPPSQKNMKGDPCEEEEDVMSEDGDEKLPSAFKKRRVVLELFKDD